MEEEKPIRKKRTRGWTDRNIKIVEIWKESLEEASFVFNDTAEYYANHWNWGMTVAALGGHKDLVDFFISKGANNWYQGMKGAAEGGHKDLVDFFKQKMKK